jgi:hypothetical protein
VSGIGWTYNNGVYTVLHRYNVTVKGDNGISRRRIEVAENATAAITLVDVNITWLALEQSPLLLRNGANLTLNITGNSILEAGGDAAGIQAPSGTRLSINGNGLLTTTGGFGGLSGGGGAGIGGGRDNSGGHIVINSGTVDAIGSGGGAGIGGGSGGSGGNLIINGGNVDAFSAGSGAGIGGGNNSAGGTITINGGAVNAKGGTGGAGIGGGSRGSGGFITINGGTVEATTGSAGNSAAIGRGNGGVDGAIIINGIYNHWVSMINTAPGTQTGTNVRFPGAVIQIPPDNTIVINTLKFIRLMWVSSP